MSATPSRSGGFQTKLSSNRRSRSADVARRFAGLAAPPGSTGDLQAKSTVLNRYGGAGNYIVPAALGLLAVGSIAAIAMLTSGCSARRNETSSNRKDPTWDPLRKDPTRDPQRSQSALCLSSKAQTTGECSTEGGGLGTDDRASGTACGQSRGGDTGAGGTASKLGSSGTGKAARDRRGLVDAWPEVRPSSCISPVPDSPLASATVGAG
jgi:hypothetical protein